MTTFNMRAGPVRTQTTNIQNMNNSNTSAQNILNLHVCSLDKRKLKFIKAEESLSHVCSAE